MVGVIDGLHGTSAYSTARYTITFKVVLGMILIQNNLTHFE